MRSNVRLISIILTRCHIGQLIASKVCDLVLTCLHYCLYWKGRNTYKPVGTVFLVCELPKYDVITSASAKIVSS